MIPYYAVTGLIAAGGVCWFSLAPSTLSYWVGGVLASTPFLALAADRSSKRGYRYPPDSGDSGAWSAP